MFDRKARRNLDPYFHVLYAMQLIAVIATAAGLFLAWWGGPQTQTLTAFDLLNQSVDKLHTRKPSIFIQPLVVLWLIAPSIAVSAVRSFTGVLVAPVWYRRLALAVWGIAALALAHFYINYGHELTPDSPLKNGHIQIGFWLTGSSTAILGLLILAEGIIKPPDTWAVQGFVTGGPVDDAERLWRGEYLTCPHCGMLNELGARSCFNCHNILFDFRDEK